MKPRMAKAALADVDLGMLAIAATLRDRATFYRLRGYELMAVELEHDATIAEALARPTVVSEIADPCLES